MEFLNFSKLRDLRKVLAEKEGIHVYTVFTNEHLAEMVRQGLRTVEDLTRIQGVGKARVEKYAEVLPLCLANYTPRQGPPGSLAPRSRPSP